MEGLAIQLVICMICGGIAAAIASGKGRNVAGWFFGGFFLGLIGIIIVACLSNLNAERAYRQQVEQANHRLREQLRQERMKGESFREYSMTRLDAHDGALGIDTRSLGPMLGGEARAQLSSQRPEDALGRLAAEAKNTQFARNEPGDGDPQAAQPGQDPEQGPQDLSWYFADAGQSYGPVSASLILQMLRQKKLHPDSLLWAEGMVDWTPARQVPIFRNAVNL